jgi:DNA helicase-2/ATP-dependent DNA helicase PcrA
VKLLTLHAAKGLEFRHVFISGVNQGMVPLASTWGDPAADAEERRLLFVGITRAKDEVELSYHTQPAHAQALAMPSPYLLPLPVASTRWLDAPEATPEASPVFGAGIRGQAQSASEEDVAPQVSPWRQGQAVRHARYGAGIITKISDGMVFCEFAKLGERSFPEKMCPLAPG